MNVIFLQSVPPHRVGEVADVTAGYAHNFLFPKKLAKPATPEAVAAAKHRQAHAENAKQKAEATTVAALQGLNGKVIPIPTKTSPSGTLYAALQPQRIFEVLEKQSAVSLPSALRDQLPTIKHTGEHAVTLQYCGQTATFTIKV